jgi:hypothetical protein
MEAITCPNCGGRGCGNCRGSGVLAVDEAGRQFYVVRNGGGELQVAGSKDGGDEGFGQNFVDRVFGIFLSLVAEPQDLFWAAKILSKRK